MTRARKATADKTRRRTHHSAAMLDTLIEEATVDAHDDSEQKTGFDASRSSSGVNVRPSSGGTPRTLKR
jgi:hypothetical protein